MFCCFRSPPVADDEVHKADSSTAGSSSLHVAQQAGSAKPAGDPATQPVNVGKPPPGRRSSSLGSNPLAAPQQATGAVQAPCDPAAEAGEGPALQAAGAHHEFVAASGEARGTAAAAGVDDGGQQGGVLKLVALLQELMALSTASPRQPLSKAMSLLVVRLPVDWACLHAISSTGRVVMQVGAALSPEAQRQRGASGSCSYATPVQNTPVRQRYSMMQGGSSTGGGMSATPGGAGGLAVQEMGGCQLSMLPGSGSSLEAVAASRQALAMYVGEEAEAGRLPKDWQRLHKDRDLRSFLAVPIIASGSSGSIIGALSFGLTSISDWGSAWWMGSIQLLCGWAAGALPQNRATARACFFDALWAAQDLDSLGHVFVHHLPHALVDPSVNKLEARLALVSSRLANCIIYASQPESSGSEQQQQQQQQVPPQAAPQQQQQLLVHQQETQQQQLHQPQQPVLLQQQPNMQQGPSPEPSKCGGQCSSSRPPTPPDVVPEGVILTGCGDNSIVGNSSSDNDTKKQEEHIETSYSGANSQQQPPADKAGPNGLSSSSNNVAAAEPVSRFSLPTNNSVLLSALEWGEVMVVKDTVTYFGRNAGGGAVRDLFLPDRPMVRGTLVLLPLLYRCRPLGCVYLLAPWDIHAALGKAALQEMAALLAAGTFKALLARGILQQQWYQQVLSEGPMPAMLPQPSAATTAAQCKGGAAAASVAAEEQQQQQQPPVEQQRVPSFSFSSSTPPATNGAAAAASAGAATSNAIAAAAGGVRSPASPDAYGSSDGAVGGTIINSTSPDSSLGPAEQRQASSSSLVVAGAAAPPPAAAAAAPLTNGSSSSTAANSCPLPLGTAAAAAEASAAASAAAQSAAALAPVGLAVSGHACAGFPELVLWPELLDVKEDLARSRHTAVYTAEHAGQLLAVKLFRFSSSMEHGHAAGHAQGISHGPAAAGGPAVAGISALVGSSSGSSGNVVRETELEAVLSLQYRLCSLQHPHILRHVAVYPHAYEVVHRRSSREPPDVYLTSILPRKERHHRCAALVTEYAGGGSLRDAVNRGAVYVPTSKALQSAAEAAGLGKMQDMAALSVQQLAVLLVQLEQQLPLAPALPQVQQRPSADMQHASAPLPAAALAGGLLGGQLTQPVPGLNAGRRSHEAAAEHMREPHIPLLRTLLLHIALGMQHLHANGIVHGELRLDNVMVSGQLPSTLELLQQQQAFQPDVLVGSSAHSSKTQQPQPCSRIGAMAAAAADPVVDQFNSSVGSATPPDTAQAGSSSSHVGSCASSSTNGTASSSSTFALKLKDIGLCTIGWSHRQVAMRKLAGRPRLQAVSWLAPECFRGDGLSKHSDVYAFGILMWELYTGQVAFNDLITGSSKVLQTIITDGVRPQFPDSAPSWYVTLASRCWSGTAKNRPSFRRIVAQLQALDKPLAAQHEQQQQQGQQQRPHQPQHPHYPQQMQFLPQDGACAPLHSSQL